MKLLLILLFVVSPTLAYAGQAEVRDVALANNCPPKKIEVYQQSLGLTGETIYRVECTLPKTVGQTQPTSANAVLVSCVQSMCALLQTVTEDKK